MRRKRLVRGDVDDALGLSLAFAFLVGPCRFPRGLDAGCLACDVTSRAILEELCPFGGLVFGVHPLASGDIEARCSLKSIDRLIVEAVLCQEDAKLGIHRRHGKQTKAQLLLRLPRVSLSQL